MLIRWIIGFGYIIVVYIVFNFVFDFIIFYF